MSESQSPVERISPTLRRSISRSPDATPVPGNPNPKLGSSIPSMSISSRRISAPPSAFPLKLSDLSMTVADKPKSAGLTPSKPGLNGTKRTPSATGSGKSTRTTSMQGGKQNQVNGRRPSVGGVSQRSNSVNLTNGKKAAVPSTPSKPAPTTRRASGKGPRPSMESVTVVSGNQPKPTPVRQSTAPPATTTPKHSPPTTRRTPPALAPSPTIFKSENPNPRVAAVAARSPKASSPKTPRSGPRLTINDVNGTPHSSPSRMARPPNVTPLAASKLNGERPSSSASSNLPGVPWSNSGVLQPINGNHLAVNGEASALRSSGGEDSYVSQPMGPGLYGDEDDQYFQNGHDYYAGTEGGDMTLDMVTDVDETEFDEDLALAFDDLRVTFMKKLIHYKRLLEQAQASSASQLHALQAELRLLRVQVDSERKTMRELEIRSGRDREALFTERRQRSQIQLDMSAGGSVFDIAALRGDGRGSFDEAEVRKVVRSLRMSDRMRLIHLILDSCLPGDVSQMIRLLEKYAASSFDIVAHLPVEIAASILSYLNLHELLEVEVVSRGWQAVVHHPSIWRRLCLQQTWSDPVQLKWPKDEADWEPLYKALHHRERNFQLGLAQSVRFLKGHTNFCTTLILKGNRLISGSYDETIRVWDVAAGKETHCLRAKAISCLDFLPEEEVLVAGFHDVGRVQVFSTVTWTLLQTLQGHLYGIRSVAMTNKYVVSAGADKALVCWDWRSGQKLVRFGQQTNMSIGVQIVDDETVVGVTIDGIVRTFSIRRKEMISQFKLNELAAGDPVMNARLAPVGVGSNNMLQWFAAKGRQMTCATKNVIIHLEWDEESNEYKASLAQSSLMGMPSPTVGGRSSLGGRPSPSPLVTSPVTSRKSLGASASSRPSLSSPRTPVSRLSMSTSSLRSTPVKSAMANPPRILAVVETPDVAVGAVDPLKRRVTTATRFSTRSGADRRIFLSTYKERRKPSSPVEDDDEPPTPSEHSAGEDLGIVPIGGAWAAVADGPPSEGMPGIVGLPNDFKGVATPGLNPMSMALSHEEVVVGCADGSIYVMSFVGWEYSKPKEEPIEEDEPEE